MIPNVFLGSRLHEQLSVLYISVYVIVLQTTHYRIYFANAEFVLLYSCGNV